MLPEHNTFAWFSAGRQAGRLLCMRHEGRSAPPSAGVVISSHFDSERATIVATSTILAQ
jgi:hypothetical protein